MISGNAKGEMEFDNNYKMAGSNELTAYLLGLQMCFIKLCFQLCSWLVSDRVETKCPSPLRHLRTHPSKLGQLERPATNPRWHVGTRRAKLRMVRKGLLRWLSFGRKIDQNLTTEVNKYLGLVNNF